MAVTRVEAALVIGALGLAVGAATLVTGTASAGAARDVAADDARRLLRATEAWMSEANQPGCPTLSTLQHDGKLDRDAVTDDPWGTRFRVVCADDGPSVRSYGQDGRRGTADDIVVTHGS